MGLSQVEEERSDASPIQPWLLPILLSGVALLLLAAGESGRELLRYDRQGIYAGEVWRLVTGHLVHLGPSHALLNIAGLLLVWYLVGRTLTAKHWVWVFCGAMLAVSAGLWVFSPSVGWYVGLSGALHGLLAAGIVALFRQRPLEAALIAVVVVGKVVFEQIAGPLPGSEATSGGNVVVDAHFYGLVGGSLVALAIVTVRSRAAI